MAGEAVACYTIYLLQSRCAFRGYLPDRQHYLVRYRYLLPQTVEKIQFCVGGSHE